MKDPDGYFDEAIASHYDEDGGMFSPEVLTPTVGFLAELAGSGRALELAIGTGRVAIPLAARGVPVAGIDMSKAMTDRLRAKPGAEGIEIAIGDMTTTRIPGEFSLVYLVYNTIANLTTQDAQVECFVNAAAHLRPGGCFVIEVGVPDLRRLPPGESAVVFELGPTKIGVDEYDVATQAMTSHHFEIVEGRATRFSPPFRYVWPSELDLMARIAGLRLRERWASWTREPFTSESRSHVSVWEKPPIRP